MSVLEEVEAEIEALGIRPRSPGVAAAALALAEAIDATDGATARANAVGQLLKVMADLRKRAPVQAEGDKLDELTKRRKERRGA